jgi:hypothetical protein
MHVVLRYQRAVPLLDPGELDLLMTVKVRIEMGQHIFLNDHRLIVGNGNSKLQYFHGGGDLQ